jgi:diguanylate cyclase (GGDEF)-like protein
LVKGAANSRELERTLRHAVQRQHIQNENRRLVSELEHAAKSDALTGVLNRHAMITEFQRHWSDSQSNKTDVSCVIFDVDHFKRINDQFGHVAGDHVLKAVAQLISNSTRPGDCIARYGGEEFCVILVECLEEDAVKWADRARHQLAHSPVQLGDQTITVTASFGAAQRTAATNTIEELIGAADQALMVAKSLGRNRVIASGDSVCSDSQVAAPILPLTGDLSTGDAAASH